MCFVCENKREREKTGTHTHKFTHTNTHTNSHTLVFEKLKVLFFSQIKNKNFKMTYLIFGL